MKKMIVAMLIAPVIAFAQTTPIPPAGGGTGAATPQQYGAYGDGVHDDTAAFNNMFAASKHGLVHIPCGTYLVSSIQLPGDAPQNTNTKIYGDGACSVIEQNSSSLANNLFQIGSGNLNDVGDILISDLFFTAASTKTGGSGIYAKGSARIQFKNIFMANMFDGISLDGVDFHSFDHVIIYGPAENGIQMWDGYDCGFRPWLKTTTGSTDTNSNIIHVSDTSNLVVGMNVFTTRPNLTSSIGTIASIQNNTSVTLQANATLAVPSSDNLIFGGDCAGTGATITGDTTILSAKNAGIALRGGVGGVYIDSAHIYSGQFGMLTTTDYALTMENREIFLFAGTDIDSNTSTGFYATNNSLTRLISTGAWINASAKNCAVFIGPQKSNTNPVEAGAMVSFTGGVIGQSGGCGLNWADSGTLSLSGVNVSYNRPASGTIGDQNGDGVVITSGAGQVNINGIVARSNSAYGISFQGGNPVSAIISGNTLTGNNSGSTQNISPSSSIVCTANLGGTGGC